MNAQCHHPRYTVNVEPDRDATYVAAAQLEAIRASIIDRADHTEPIVTVGASAYVTVVECSQCRKPEPRPSGVILGSGVAAFTPLKHAPARSWWKRRRLVAAVRSKLGRTPA